MEETAGKRAKLGEGEEEGEIREAAKSLALPGDKANKLENRENGKKNQEFVLGPPMKQRSSMYTLQPISDH